MNTKLELENLNTIENIHKLFSAKTFTYPDFIKISHHQSCGSGPEI